jgi:RNA polymerase sigma factor (sigma-70 family)
MLKQSGRPCLRPPHADNELATLVSAAAAGDQSALTNLVARYDRLLRGVARSYRLSTWDTDDVIQATWLQFIQHARALREPAAVSGWLATTARRQSLQTLRRHVREDLTDDPAYNRPGTHAEPEHELIAAEREAVLQRALSGLPGRQRRLMTILTANPELSYEQVARHLSMPIGSIGPTRGRSLDRLRRCSELQGLQAAHA